METYEINKLLDAYSTSGRVYITLEEYMCLEPLIQAINKCRNEFLLFIKKDLDKIKEQHRKIRECQRLIGCYDHYSYKYQELNREMVILRNEYNRLIENNKRWKDKTYISDLNAALNEYNIKKTQKTMNNVIDIEKNITITFEQYKMMLEPQQAINDIIKMLMNWFKENCSELTD